MKYFAPSCITALLGMAAACYFLITGDATVIGKTREQGIFMEKMEQEKYDEAGALLEREEDMRGYLTVPIPDEADESNISIENNVNDKTVSIIVKNVSQDFYHKNIFSGDMTNINSIKYGYMDDSAIIMLSSDEVVEAETRFYHGHLYVRLVDPHEAHDKIVVIDPGHGGDDAGSVVYGISEKSIIDGVADELREILDSDDYGIYYTRVADRDTSEEERLDLIRSVSADLVVSIHTGADTNSRTVKGCSAETLSGNEAIAEKFLDAISSNCAIRNNGVKCGSSLSLINEDGCPTVFLRIGNLTNRTEAEEMATAEFQANAAEAIKKSILEYLKSEEN
ncbi:MAG: N-acetylmuramoyl-L-alanine amidase [Lachnospiraceae bacterium]|nr:N-acetylmuramoyl-L-alanine amidase [Lachnospiraceae bacterium]